MNDEIKQRLDVLDAVASANTNILAAIIDALHAQPNFDSSILQAFLEDAQRLPQALPDKTAYTAVTSFLVNRDKP